MNGTPLNGEVHTDISPESRHKLLSLLSGQSTLVKREDAIWFISHRVENARAVLNGSLVPQDQVIDRLTRSDVEYRNSELGSCLMVSRHAALEKYFVVHPAPQHKEGM